jgi:DNA-binding transcriptional MerR regulator
VEPVLPPDSIGSAPSSSVSGERSIGIGQVVRLLSPEFTDLSISKVRYLEDRGLVRPRRTSGGYRKYSPADVRRLRTILSLQRDEFLPLDVIRERIDRGTAGSAGRVLASTTPLEAPQALHRQEQQLSWQEVLETSEVGEDLLRQLVEFRIVERAPGSAEAVFSETEVEIARVCGLLARFGLEPRNLRLLRSSVERDVAMVEQIVAPSLRSPHAERREQGERTVLDLGLLISRLKDLLLLKDMRELVQRY